MKQIQLNPQKCMGCQSCELACSFKNERMFNPLFSRIFVKVEGAFHSPLTCLQCEDPYCAQVCPRKAIERNPNTGVVEVSESLCIGCRMCTLACPFGLIVIGIGKKAVKCDLCGGDPECAKACTYGAITYSEDYESEKQKRNMVFGHLKKSFDMLVDAPKEFKFPEITHR
ncbi:MAG: 4Fe-4S dicluster domain-containing protein [Syntrophales bacterium]